ncbi:alpha/beta hydrolase, partial [Blastopirellula marina]
MNRTSFAWLMLVVALLCSAISSPLLAEEPTQPVKKLVLPGESFLIDEHPAFILWPSEENRRDPQPWVLYGPTLPAYPDVHERWMHQQLVDAGIAVAGIDVGEAYGSPKSQAAFTALYQELTEKRGFAKKPCLLGRSRGGLWVSSWAIRNTDKVAGIAGIYPVYDLTTYPGLERAAPAYGLSVEELSNTLAEHNPISQADRLAEANIPVFIIHGDHDTVVPLKENSATLAAKYEAAGNGDSLELVIPQGQGHNFWAGFFHCQSLVEFAIDRARVGAGLSPRKKKSLPAPDEAVVYRDLEYAKVGDMPLLLDLYYPKDATAPVPVVVWIHGGGWNKGSKNRCPATWLVEAGYAVASIDYRLTGTAKWPAQIEDCRAAVRWLRSNSQEFQFDAERIGVWGGSAGGHLAALLGTLDVPADEAISSQVQAVCDWYGPSDLLTMPANVIGNGRTAEDVAKSNGAQLLGGPIPDLPKLAREVSPFYQASAGDSPFFIMHGSEDNRVPLSQSEKLHEKLQSVGVPVTLHVVEG